MLPFDHKRSGKMPLACHELAARLSDAESCWSWVGFLREWSMYYSASKFYLVASITTLAFATVFMMLALASWSVEKTDGPEIRFELRQSLQR